MESSISQNPSLALQRVTKESSVGKTSIKVNLLVAFSRGKLWYKFIASRLRYKILEQVTTPLDDY